MFDPRSIRKGVVVKPRKMILYGESKIGKSTIAAAAPKSFLIALEDRVNHIRCDKTEVLKQYEDVLDVLDFIEHGEHDYQSLVVDSLDWLAPLIHSHICKEKGFKSLYDDSNKEVNYGRGMKYHAVEGWKKFLQRCDDIRESRNMHIVFICHSAIETIMPPDSESYGRFSLKLDKNEIALLFEWSDIIAFYSREKVITQKDAGFGRKIGKAINIDGDRVIHLQATSPAWVSGNSFDLSDCIVTVEDAPEIMRYILNTEELEQNSTKKTNNKKEVK